MMQAQRLADPSKLTELEPSFPSSLDTDFQVTDWDRFTNPRLFERILKLHGLLSPHLVISDAQVLDHLALRLFLLDLKPSKRAQVISYLTTPGSSNLGPLVLASEAYDPSNLTAPFPLHQLLQRKLGLDERKKETWGMSSFNPAKRPELNQQVAKLEGDSRFQFVVDNLEPQHGYGQYLTFASDIWDANASVTRLPSQPFELRPHLQMSLDGVLQNQTDQRVREVAAMLKEQLATGKITYGGTEKSLIIRSTVRPWLRENLGPRGNPVADFFDELLNRAWCEAFVTSLPGHRGWVGTCDPKVSHLDNGREERASNGRHPATDTAAKVAVETFEVKTGGPLILDRLGFDKLKALRSDETFQQSLANLQKEWWCPNPYNNGLKPALKSHFDLIYKLLKANLRSSRIREDGDDLGVQLITRASPFLAPVVETARGQFNLYSWVAASMGAVLLNFWICERKRKQPQRWVHDLEERVFEASSRRDASEKPRAGAENTSC